MRKLPLPLVLLLAAWTLGRPGQAQESIGGIFFSKYRQFRIPFQANPLGQQRLKQLQLFVSTDQGKSWQPSAVAPPDQGHFRFLCDRDGYFWFTVQTTDQENKVHPPSLDGAQASLKVIVDTLPPNITLQPLASRGGEVGVAWDIRDDNLDLSLSDALRLEYRAAGGGNWTPLPRNPVATQHYWNPDTSAAVEVRLRARDRAGNWGEASTTVSLGGQGGLPPPPQGHLGQGNAGELPPAVFNGPAEGERRLVNQKRINLNYQLDEVGPSGVATLEMWFTQDGRAWNKYPHKLSEDPQNQKNVSFELPGEGLYGITLVAKSGVGLGEKPPQPGDRPQLWVEIDLHKPIVHLSGVYVGQGLEKGKLSITWTARDKNLHRQPITLSYAEQKEGPWTPISQNLTNSGRYIWTMPERVPYQFLVRVEAIDQAGNVGEAVTEQLVKVDLSQPKVKILNVEPAGR
jgi:hypothetical protein